MDTPERPQNARQHRLVTVRGAGGTTRQIETRCSSDPMAVTGRATATGQSSPTRADGDPQPGFEGYASTFWMVDAYGTAIAPGAFTKTLVDRGDKHLVLWQHNPDWPIGRPLEARQDDTGLFVRDAISDVLYGRDCLTLLADGVPLGLSIGFQTIRERPATPQDPLRFGDMTPRWATENPDWLWVIEEVKLYEHSPVSFPANDEAAPTVIHGSPDGLLALALLEDLRTGRLRVSDRALAADIAAAYAAAAPEGHPTPPRTAAEERADRQFIAQLLTDALALPAEPLCVA